MGSALLLIKSCQPMKSRFYNYVIIVIRFFVSFGKASAQIDKKIVPFRSFFVKQTNNRSQVVHKWRHRLRGKDIRDILTIVLKPYYWIVWQWGWKLSNFAWRNLWTIPKGGLRWGICTRLEIYLVYSSIRACHPFQKCLFEKYCRPYVN